MHRPSSSTARRNEILTGAVVLGLSIGSFLIGELGLRAVQFARFGIGTSADGVPAAGKDETSEPRLPTPGTMRGLARINNLGYRGPDILAHKPKGVFRLLFMGSSTTYSAAVAEGKNWPHLTTSLLSRALPDCRIDFINAGRVGFSLREVSRLYETHLRVLDPDVAILLPGDLNNNLDWLAGKQGFDTTHYHPSMAAQNSVLWAKLEKNFRMVELQRTALSHAGKARLDQQALSKRFGERLSNLTNALRRDGVTLVVAKNGSQLQPGQASQQQIRAAVTALFYMPQYALPDILAARLRLNAVIDELAPTRGFASIDSALRVPGDIDHYIDTTHFTALGSEVMARGTVAALLAAPLVRARLQESGCTPPPRPGTSSSINHGG